MLTCLKQGPGVTPQCVCEVDGGHDMVAIFTPCSGRGDYQLWGADISWAHSLPGKPVERHAPHHPFDKLSLAGVWGKYVGRSVM